jgi:tetratricopeptide (TPR) repeat protein
VAGAKAELAKLESADRPHPLLPELRAFVKRFDVAVDAGAEKKVAVVDLTSLPPLPRGGSGEGDVETATGDGTDYRSLLKAAANALAAGNADKAEGLYNLVLEKSPGNSEAISGLGDVAKLRKDPAAAEKAYEKALKENPTYLPALIARADQKWESGDRSGAIALYRRVLEHAGASSPYGQRASARIAQGAGSGSGTSGSTDTEPPATAKPPSTVDTSDLPPSDTPPPKPTTDTPAVDTSDLPGFSK